MRPTGVVVVLNPVLEEMLVSRKHGLHMMDVEQSMYLARSAAVVGSMVVPPCGPEENTGW